MRIFLSAGEASGDAYGAALVREIKRLSNQSCAFEAIGGQKLHKEGVTIHADSSKWGAMSISKGIQVGFRILPHYLRVKGILRRGQPGLFIPIDFGFANIRLAKHAKRNGWKVLYFVPPGSWRRDRQGKDLPSITDAIVTPFDWSAEILNKMGAKAHWFGHPILQLMREATQEPLATPASQGEALEKRIAVLPGSRAHELEMTLPLVAGAIQGQSTAGSTRTNTALANQLEFALAPSVDADQCRQTWNRLAPGRNDLFTVGDTYGVLRRAYIGIICSGTATLEAAICGCPMVIIYQLTPSMRREANLLRLKQPKFVGLPNIIQDREIVPELADGQGVFPEQLRAEVDRLLTQDSVRSKQVEELKDLVTSLGSDDAITKTAELALQMISA